MKEATKMVRTARVAVGRMVRTIMVRMAKEVLARKAEMLMLRIVETMEVVRMMAMVVARPRIATPVLNSMV